MFPEANFECRLIDVLIGVNEEFRGFSEIVIRTRLDRCRFGTKESMQSLPVENNVLSSATIYLNLTTK